MSKKFTEEQIKEFWQQHDRFLHANLVTEAPHPLSYNLSQLCSDNLPQAFKLFQEIELRSIDAMLNHASQIEELRHDIQNCIGEGHKIFLIGCGASGRLAMLLKRIYELQHPELPKQIVCVSSAGDTSLIKAVEQFEDNAEFGIKQLLQQDFTENDLLIGLSASGESPFIVAAVEYAGKTAKKPWLLFNNPIGSLLERNSNHVLLNPKIKFMALDVGAMALTGSTRLQATTAMQIAVGLALVGRDNIMQAINEIYSLIKAVPLANLADITQYEAEILEQNHFILYKTDNALIGLSMLADITERAPTFNLTPFENTGDKLVKPSPFYLSLSNTDSVANAWDFLFGQAPTCLEWQEFPATGRGYMNGFDLSSTSARANGKYLLLPQHEACWQPLEHELSIQLDEVVVKFNLPNNLFYQTLVYKLLLNSHSTLMMGRLGYFSGNMMVSLKPSNFKLIDRAIRYSQFILKEQYKIEIDYTELAAVVFTQIEQLEAGQSIVNQVVAAVNGKHR